MKKDYTSEREEAYQLFLKGMKYQDIADAVGVTLSAVKSWATRYWKKEKVATENEQKVATKRKRGGQPGNKNATGPPRNQNARKHGLFSKWLPVEINEIIGEMPTDPLDILWDNIQLQYAKIIHSQQIMHVKDINDKTIEQVEEKSGNVMGAKWEVQQAWDKEASNLKAQSRAMATLLSMIKEYVELSHRNWNMLSEEQKARLDLLKAQKKKIDIESDDDTEMVDDGFLEALNSSAKDDWNEED